MAPDNLSQSCVVVGAKQVIFRHSNENRYIRGGSVENKTRDGYHSDSTEGENDFRLRELQSWKKMSLGHSHNLKNRMCFTTAV